MREGGRLKKREREGGVKQMCQNCIPTMNMNTLCFPSTSNVKMLFLSEFLSKNYFAMAILENQDFYTSIWMNFIFVKGKLNKKGKCPKGKF